MKQLDVEVSTPANEPQELPTLRKFSQTYN